MTSEHETLPIWEQQPDETWRWYSCFCLYRDAGPLRSLMKAVHKAEEMAGREKRSKSVPGAWWKAYTQYHWEERARTYDGHLQAEKKIATQRIMIANPDAVALDII